MKMRIADCESRFGPATESGRTQIPQSIPPRAAGCRLDHQFYGREAFSQPPAGRPAGAVELVVALQFGDSGPRFVRAYFQNSPLIRVKADQIVAFGAEVVQP